MISPMTSETMGRLLKLKKHDTIVVYCFILDQCILRKSNQIWCKVDYIAKGLGWGHSRVSNARKILFAEGFLSSVKTRDKKGYISKELLKVKYAPLSLEKYSVEDLALDYSDPIDREKPLDYSDPIDREKPLDYSDPIDRDLNNQESVDSNGLALAYPIPTDRGQENPRLPRSNRLAELTPSSGDAIEEITNNLNNTLTDREEKDSLPENQLSVLKSCPDRAEEIFQNYPCSFLNDDANEIINKMNHTYNPNNNLKPSKRELAVIKRYLLLNENAKETLLNVIDGATFSDQQKGNKRFDVGHLSVNYITKPDTQDKLLKAWDLGQNSPGVNTSQSELEELERRLLGEAL
jgi:hypothetical protein